MKMQRAVQDFAWREGEAPKQLKKFKKKNQLFIGKGLTNHSKHGK
jgi:precorrin-6B methylase 2